MRILTVGNMYPPHHLGGYELTWRSSVEHLRAAGHTVAVLTTDFHRHDPDPAFPDDDADVCRDLRWYWRDHEFPAMSLAARMRLERHNKATMAAELEALRPDAVCWWAMGGMSLALIDQVRRAGIPAVGVVGDDWLGYGPQVDGWTRFLRRLRLRGPRLDGVAWLFNSVATRDASPEPGAVVHPGIDDALLTPAPPREWSWALLHVGRLDERKGIDTAIDVLTHLPGEATLTVLGSGDDRLRAELETRARDAGLAERVLFGERPRDELPAAYAAADALLFPVRWEEPWGLVPLEAMAVGTPVVATGTGGSAEYLRDRENAMVVGRGASAADVAAAVRTLAGDSALRERLRSGGRATAARYTERAYNQAIEDALERAIG